ncbi:DNA repair protein RecO [Microvirga sp. W0021]|uniref:DNA repair protein RecO n=1 Tax=Hohaiivirga grylli TaxID=3133970 RepID=A0ABV0BM50_9HYPH
MQWNDEGLILGSRRHGETAVILEVMTRDHGRHFGLVHGGASKSKSAMLQAGNIIDLTWRARLDDHLGTMQVEAKEMRTSRFLMSACALHGFLTLAAFLRVLPERDPHSGVYEAVNTLIDQLDNPEVAAILFVHFERAFLAELGFGLDLSCCAATGTHNQLIYVSPRTGRAVSRIPGEPYKERMLQLPSFLLSDGRGIKPMEEDILAGFNLTGHFLKNWIFEPRAQDIPPERQKFISLVLKDL